MVHVYHFFVRSLKAEGAVSHIGDDGNCSDTTDC